MFILIEKILLGQGTKPKEVDFRNYSPEQFFLVKNVRIFAYLYLSDLLSISYLLI